MNTCETFGCINEFTPDPIDPFLLGKTVFDHPPLHPFDTRINPIDPDGYFIPFKKVKTMEILKLNAIILDAELKREYKEAPIKLWIEFKANGLAVQTWFKTEDVIRIFNVLEVDNLKKLINCPCVIEITDKILTKVYNFLDVHRYFEWKS